MASRPPVNVVIIAISVIATAGLALAIVGVVHHNWALVIEGSAVAALLYALTIRTARRERNKP